MVWMENMHHMDFFKIKNLQAVVMALTLQAYIYSVLF